MPIKNFSFSVACWRKRGTVVSFSDNISTVLYSLAIVKNHLYMQWMKPGFTRAIFESVGIFFVFSVFYAWFYELSMKFRENSSKNAITIIRTKSEFHVSTSNYFWIIRDFWVFRIKKAQKFSDVFSPTSSICIMYHRCWGTSKLLVHFIINK